MDQENYQPEWLKQGERPFSWIEGSFSTYCMPWKLGWPVHLMNDIQKWGDSNCCRFLLTSEYENGYYELKLYIAPKPNGRVEGLCNHSIRNRDKGMTKFQSWFEGLLAGKGIE